MHSVDATPVSTIDAAIIGSNDVSFARGTGEGPKPDFQAAALRSPLTAHTGERVVPLGGSIDTAALARRSVAEAPRLRSERTRLAIRLLSGDITQDEQRRLAYLEWELDRIEEAQMPTLDVLQSIASERMRLARDVQNFVRDVAAVARPHRKARR